LEAAGGHSHGVGLTKIKPKSHPIVSRFNL
jgi:hypothetical protein